jgi:molybdopterin synthase catalytic subunit
LESSGKVVVQEEDFRLDEAVAEVKQSSRTIGGIVAFLGVVRDFSRNEGVEKLFFEYYPGMAEKTLAELREEALKRFALKEMSIRHRHGELLPGDNIVLIIAAGEHRREAFEAAQWCMAELKKKVPIWKKEHFASGEVWVEGEGAS